MCRPQKRAALSAHGGGDAADTCVCRLQMLAALSAHGAALRALRPGRELAGGRRAASLQLLQTPLRPAGSPRPRRVGLGARPSACSGSAPFQPAPPTAVVRPATAAEPARRARAALRSSVRFYAG